MTRNSLRQRSGAPVLTIFKAGILAALMATMVGPVARGQIEERWILYGHFETDSGERVLARYRIEHPRTPWLIALAQYGEERVDFLNERISDDLQLIEFSWPDREYGECRLERVFEGEEVWQSVWKGVCANAAGGQRALKIGAIERPDMGRSLAISQVDLEILNHAASLLTAETWNRTDDRICSDDIREGRVSLFCAIYQASVVVEGEYLHRRPATRALRDVVYEAGETRIGSHTLMDYNNHSDTTLEDLLDRLAEASSALRSDLE
jgi:hypothetical protein